MTWFKTLTTFFLLFGFLTTADSRNYTTRSYQRSLKAVSFELEQEMSRALEAKIDKVLGRENFWLTLHLSVDKKHMEADFLSLVRDHQNQKNPKREGKKFNQLPGLFIGKNGAPEIKDDDGQSVVVLGEGPELTKSFVLSYVNEVSVEVAIDKENEKKAQNTLRKLVSEYFQELDISVQLKFNRKKIAGLVEIGEENKEGEATVASSRNDIKIDSKGLAQDLSKIVLRDFFNTIDGRYGQIAFITAMVLLGLVLLFGFLGLVMTIRNSRTQRLQMEKLVKGMSDSLSGLGSGGGAHATQLDFKENTGDKNTQTGENEIELMAQIQKVLVKSPTLTGYLLKFFFRERMHENCLLILQCLGPEYIAWPKKEIGEELFMEFIVGLRENGNVYFDREHRLKSLKALYAKIWQASFNISNFMCEELREKLAGLDKDAALQLFSQCNLEETAAVIEMLRPEVVAQVISQGNISAETLGRLPASSMSREILKTMLDKVGLVGMHSETGRSFMEKVAQFLPLDLEKKLLSSAGMPSGFHLEELAREFSEAFNMEISFYSLEDLASLLAVVTPELKQMIIQGLPEIKARRLEQRSLKATPRGLELKNLLVEKLKTLHGPEKWNEYNRYLKLRFDARKTAQKSEAMRNDKITNISSDSSNFPVDKKKSA